MKKYIITFKTSKRSDILKWERFAYSRNDAIESAIRALDEAYFGNGILINVELI